MRPARRTAGPQQAPSPQRAHRPNDLGPRLEQRGRWWTADLRPWGGARYVALRDPRAPGWPDQGERTEHQDVAERWKWTLLDHLTGESRRRQLGHRPKGRRLGRAVDDFLDQRTLSASPSTVAGDRTALTVHLRPGLDPERNVDDIDVAALQALFNDLLRRGYHPGTLSGYRDSLRVFLRWCGRSDDQNPAHGIVLPPVVRGDPRSLSDAELVDLRTVADDMVAGRRPWVGLRRVPFDIRRAIELGLGMGGRHAELFALDWSAFRPRECTVRVTVQVDRVRKGLRHLKGKRARTALVLPGWWDHHQPKARGLVLDAPRFDQSFLHQTQTWLNTLYAHVDLKVNGQSWHVLRHTYSRLFLESGGRLEQLQKFLGHASISITERSYGHLSNDAAATLARHVIYGPPGPPGSPGSAGSERGAPRRAGGRGAGA